MRSAASPAFSCAVSTSPNEASPSGCCALAQGSPPWAAIDAEKAIPWVEKKTGKTLAASQRAAIAMALRAKVAVITGGPGVGKTTLLDAILRILAAKGVKILLGAPTGRAAKRMTEQTGHRVQKPSIACSRSIPYMAVSSAMRGTRSIATCSSSTRRAWWMFR